MMKKSKWLSAILVAVLLLASAASAMAAMMTQAEKVLYKEGTDAFLDLVAPNGIGQHYVQEGYSEVKVWSPESPVVAQDSDEHAAQVQYSVCMQETNGVGFTVEAVRWFYYVPWGAVIQSEYSLFEDNHAYIPPYGKLDYGAGSPRSGNFRYEIVVVAGTDDNGHAQEFYGIVERLNFTEAEGTAVAAADPEHDTRNLRYGADYEVKVADDVWWVPAVSLGESRYTNREIAAQVNLEPEEKQANMDTLYEALQLFQIGNFANGNDNQRIMENDIAWEHHKPGYHAVRTNMGCCATDSNWLNYILKDNYEQVGFLAYSQADGGGHILNYLYHDGYYYFIDLTHYRTDFLDSSAPETGLTGDYHNSDFIAGNIHKAASPEAYVKYCRDSFNDPPELFFLYQAEDCLPVDGVRTPSGICITYANTADVKVVYDDPEDTLTCAFVDPPRKAYDWAGEPTAQFVVDAQYLDEAADVTAVQQDIFQVGDEFTLVDYGQQAQFAEINGEDYSLGGRSGFGGLSFEEDIFLYGGCHYTYLNYELPVHEHAAALETMDSVRVGELMIDMLGGAANVQIARCVEQDGKLVVTDIIHDAHYYEPVYVRKDDTDRWQSSECLWFVFHYEANGELLKEYGRFFCKGN